MRGKYDRNLRKTAKACEKDSETDMQKVAYIDLHCDTLTVCADRGKRLKDCGLQTDLEKLKKNGCAAQCFAVFTQGETAADDYERYYAAFLCEIREGGAFPVTCGRDLEYCLNTGKTGAILTLENLGFLGTHPEKLIRCYARGVRMASLVWNYENDYAYPNLKFKQGQPLFAEREERGLKDCGRRAVELMDGLGIIIDISHLSDGGAKEILHNRKIPVVASHSNAAEVCGVCRNLTDELIRRIADCGGVVGVNFCMDFVGNSDIFAGLSAHIAHIVKVGGEDVIALGSDFDGIPAPEGLEDCTRVPALFDFLSAHGMRAELLEKLARKNFMRVFNEVCGR